MNWYLFHIDSYRQEDIEPLVDHLARYGLDTVYSPKGTIMKCSEQQQTLLLLKFKVHMDEIDIIEVLRILSSDNYIYDNCPDAAKLGSFL
jgi:hypothetical protein